MAGGACKIIIDSMRTAIAEALHEVVDSTTGKTLLNEDEAAGYYQRLSDIDNIAFTGGFIPDGGLRGIAIELTKKKVFDRDVWVMMNPGSFARELSLIDVEIDEA